jgi:hypothetical protein
MKLLEEGLHARPVLTYDEKRAEFLEELLGVRVSKPAIYRMVRRLGCTREKDHPGFEAFPHREYSEVFFDDGHMVLRGISWAAHPSATRNTFRNWDFPVRRQLFLGFRCARDA